MENIAIIQPVNDGTTQNFFTGSVPRNYDNFMGPILLNSYAADLVNRVKGTGKIKVLELAAGTGRVTKPLLAALPDAQILATDISEDMMDIAKESIISENLNWQNVNMMEIPFADNEFDLIICQFGLMFVPNKPKALTEMYRVLKPGGQLLFNTWGNLDLNPVWQISFNLFRETFGELPMLKENGPFGLPAVEPVIELMAVANFTNITGTEVHKMTEVASASTVANGFLMTQPMLKDKPDVFAAMYQKLQQALLEKLGDNPLRSPLLALVFEATK